jgi:serine/threonine protein kinase
MAPEQARGGRVTESADVWGLGAVLHAAVSGHPPYGDVGPTGGSTDSSDATMTQGAEADPAEVAYPQLAGDPAALGSRGAVPARLSRLVDACLRREPETRPSLAEVTRELGDWLAADGPGDASR